MYLNNPRYSKMKDKDYFDKLYKGAKSSTFRNAKELRSAETEAEKKLWELLRNRRLKGKKFRRQHAIGDFVLDFYCSECKLTIELDGEIHNQKEIQQYDLARTAKLKDYDITVIRFWNAEVISNTDKVLERIAQFLK
jgi:very-short-patch-repair endonuclease